MRKKRYIILVGVAFIGSLVACSDNGMKIADNAFSPIDSLEYDSNAPVFNNRIPRDTLPIDSIGRKTNQIRKMDTIP